MPDDRTTTPPGRTRQDRAIDWTVAHAGELAGVGVPLLGGVFWTAWLDLVSAAVAAAWVVYEVRLRRATRTARQVAAVAPRQLTTGSAAAPAPSGDAPGAVRREVR